MFQDPLFILVIVACLAVLGVLVTGVVGFARGGEFNRKYANKIMRLRIALQFLAVVLFMLFLYLRSKN